MVVSLRTDSSWLATLVLGWSILPAAAQPTEGFAPLFDGTLGAGVIENGGAFTIADGVLHAEGPNGWLRFPGTARDFRLRVELRSSPTTATAAFRSRAAGRRVRARLAESELPGTALEPARRRHRYRRRRRVSPRHAARRDGARYASR